ncbi:transposase [Mesorhizobium sp. M0871]|uniref:transposase n=1 Tax=Mesorhizobium sp. M0871 TaxID=2957017 RepID=UPI00333C22A7
MFDGAGRFVSAILRPAKRPSGAEIRPSPAPSGAGDPDQLAEHSILLRGDSHYCNPGHRLVLRVDFIFGLAPTTTLRKHVADLEASTTARFEASAKRGKVRMSKELIDGARGAAGPAALRRL